jgi:hypothetical protein
VIRIGRNVTMQDQSQRKNVTILSWFEPSQEVITLRPVLLYYTNEFDTPDRLWAAIFIVWRTAS